MPPSAAQIKEKLLKAIDEDHNITNTKVVVEVIDLLEKTGLTREDLENTRLGLIVNNVRRKTTNQALSKRCRQLVKAWQKIASSGVAVTPPVNSSRNASPAPGRSPAVNTARVSPASAPYTSVSPRVHKSAHNKSASPLLQAPGKTRLVSPIPGRVASPAGRLVSPLVRGSGSSKAPTSTTLSRKSISPASSAAAQLKRISPSSSRLTTPNSSNTPFVTVSPASIPSRPETPNSSCDPTKDVKNKSRIRTPTPTNNNQSSHNVDNTNRKHAGNKKRRRSDDSIGSDASSVKKVKPTVNGESSSKPVEPRTKSRVKTTVELIADLQATKSTRLTASDTITKIVTNQIEKEEDDIKLSVVPPSAKPRQRRKNGNVNVPTPPAAPADLSRTKSDLVHRFLQQVEESKDDDSSHAEEAEVDILGNGSSEVDKPIPPKPVIDMSIDAYSLLPPINYDELQWEDSAEPESGAVKRNAITGEYPDGHDRSPSLDSEPDERIIDRVVVGEWNGVNGTLNVNNEFNPWTETFTISQCDEEAVHVLPYVDI